MTNDNIRANLLYVDDLQTNLILFQATFEKDYNVIITDSPEKAMDIMRGQNIQVLVTDQRMPGMTGTELLERVAGEFPEVRRFLLTAYTDFETVVEAVNKGRIHGYINKPIQADQVRVSINNALEIYYLREKNKQIMRELEKANNELLSMDGVKTEILKMITREIRTPLNRIMGTIHFLKDKIESTELVDVLNILDSSVLKLERFSSMAEQISVLKSAERSVRKEEISMKQLIEYTLVETAEWIKENDVSVHVEQKEASTIMGDFDLLISCLTNLLDHAMVHCDPKEPITVTTTCLDECPVCELTFAGRNYTDKQVRELSMHYSETVKQMNLRLGIEMALAQLIMEAHDGFVRFMFGEDGKVRLRLVFGTCAS